MPFDSQGHNKYNYDAQKGDKHHHAGNGGKQVQLTQVLQKIETEYLLHAAVQTPEGSDNSCGTDEIGGRKGEGSQRDNRLVYATQNRKEDTCKGVCHPSTV